jgi:gas vesicle protein
MENLFRHIIQSTSNNNNVYNTRLSFQLQNLRNINQPNHRIQTNINQPNHRIQTNINQTNHRIQTNDNINYNTLQNEIYDTEDNITNSNENIRRLPILTIPINSIPPINSTNLANNEDYDYENYELYYNDERNNGNTLNYNDFSYDRVNNLIRMLINQSDSDNEFNEVNHVLQESMENLEQNMDNDENEINSIKTKLNYDVYKNKKYKVKNDICPISLCEFNENDKILIIMPCLHCISYDFENEFLKTCKKCPLCNYKLI